MSETAAKPEYCAECGGVLGMVRMLMPPEYWPVHSHCVEKYRARVAKIEPVTDTSNNFKSLHHE